MYPFGSYCMDYSPISTQVYEVVYWSRFSCCCTSTAILSLVICTSMYGTELQFLSLNSIEALHYINPLSLEMNI